MNRKRLTSLGRRLSVRAAAVLSASLGLAACASDVPPPTAQLGASSQAILTAERAGALQYSPVEYQSAREKLAAADAAMRADERTRARRLAEEAQVEAELATVRAQRANAQQAASVVRGPAITTTPSLNAPTTSATAPLLPPVNSGSTSWNSPRTLEGTP